MTNTGANPAAWAWYDATDPVDVRRVPRRGGEGRPQAQVRLAIAFIAIIAIIPRCKKCNGRKVNRERKILEVSVDKGMEDGQKVTFSGEGDQEPGLEPGDIIIVLDEKAHALFKRNGQVGNRCINFIFILSVVSVFIICIWDPFINTFLQDLIMKMDISLTEALTGLKKAVKTLDERTLVIQTVRGKYFEYNPKTKLASYFPNS